VRSSYATRELATEQIATGSALIAFLKQDCIAFGVCIECIVEDSIEFNIVCMDAMLGMGGMVVAVVMIIIFVASVFLDLYLLLLDHLLL